MAVGELNWSYILISLVEVNECTRICPGSDMGMNTIMITIASVLSVFTIGHATDDLGNIIPVEDKVTSDFLS